MLNIRQIRTKLETSSVDTGKYLASGKMQSCTSNGIYGGADWANRHIETMYLRMWQEYLEGRLAVMSEERKPKAIEKV